MYTDSLLWWGGGECQTLTPDFNWDLVTLFNSASTLKVVNVSVYAGKIARFDDMEGLSCTQIPFCDGGEHLPLMPYFCLTLITGVCLHFVTRQPP